MATTYKPVEISYLRHIISLIVYNNRKFELPSTAAVNAGKTIPGPGTASADESQPRTTASLSTSNACAALDMFVTDGWLRRSRYQLTLTHLLTHSFVYADCRAGKYTLSPRVFLELEKYLERTFEDVIEKCHHCEKIVSVCHRCPSPSCQLVLHWHCARTLFRLSSSSSATQDVKCPKCSTPWKPQTSNKSRRTGDNDDDEENETDDDNSGRRTRDKRRRSIATSQIVADETMEDYN